jgi:hypothetical protein
MSCAPSLVSYNCRFDSPIRLEGRNVLTSHRWLSCPVKAL